MLITEAELREYWQNGRGQIPAFPAGTRFTPSAQDFLKSLALVEGASRGGSAQTQAPATPLAGAEMLLQSPPGQRLIITAQEVPAHIPPGTQKIVLHPSVTLTDAAREQLRAAGVRIVPYVESAPPPPPLPPTAPAAADEALFKQVKAAVLARLDAPVDETVLDAVLKRVLAGLSWG